VSAGGPAAAEGDRTPHAQSAPPLPHPAASVPAVPGATECAPRVEGTVDDLSRFLVSSQTRIAQILSSLLDHAELVTAYFNRGRDFLLTAVVHVDPIRKTVVIDRGKNEALNQKLLASERVVLVSVHEKVKVQFSVKAISAVQFDGRPAFEFPLPTELLKLQRREFFRVRTSGAEPVRCRLPVEGKERLEAPVLDISIGGLALYGRLPRASGEIGTRFPGVGLQVGDDGWITVEMELRNCNDIRLRNGVDTCRLGFRFIDLPETAQQMIQRYILRVERDRNTRDAELS